MDYGERVRLGYADPEEPEPRPPRLPRRGGAWHHMTRVSTIRDHALLAALANLDDWRCASPTIDDDDIPF